MELFFVIYLQKDGSKKYHFFKNFIGYIVTDTHLDVFIGYEEGDVKFHSFDMDKVEMYGWQNSNILIKANYHKPKGDKNV